MKNISIIVAHSLNRVIGNDGRIPWNIEGEKQRFKELTTGNVVIMGRRTYEEIGHPLPDRETIVVSGKYNYDSDNCRTAKNLADAIRMAGDKQIFISGGQRIYEEAIPLADTLYITEIDAYIEGDTFFPEFDLSMYERTVEASVENAELPYKYVTYVKRN